MEVYPLHSWNVSTSEATEIQHRLRQLIDVNSPLDISRLRVVGAADVSFNKSDNFLYAAVGLFRFSDLEIMDLQLLKKQTQFPYIPGFLSFREIPPLLDIFNRIRVLPDVILCDGQGIAHPRGVGLASHLGLILQRPAVGCAKSLLVGEYHEPAVERGSYSDLIYKNETVGVALRTRRSVKPVFISCGHRITLPGAIEVVLKCTPRFRIPQPIRLVHQAVNEFRREDRNESVKRIQ